MNQNNLSKLSKLSQVPLREVWENEAADFTPWLAQPDGLRQLGEKIHIELELEAQEERIGVGGFRADIICRDTTDGSWVIIENQLDQTDHSHLGQLLTYAAGLQAVTVVWIAERIKDDHRAALDWLNETTEEKFKYFGLEIEVLQIDDSRKAPNFKIVSEPNDWSKDVAKNISPSELTETKRLQLEFWTGFMTHLENCDTPLRAVTPQAQHWMDFGRLGRSEFGLRSIASTVGEDQTGNDKHEIRAELILKGPNAKTYYDQLEERREEIEEKLGKLTWLNPPEKVESRLHLKHTVNLDDNNRWPEYFDWLSGKMGQFHEVFRPLVRDLKA